MRALITVSGRVQGVGFRPFVYRLAVRNGLSGYVRNRDGVVEILVEGDRGRIERFLALLRNEKPPSAYVQSVKVEYIGGGPSFKNFKIEESPRERAFPESFAPADLSICDECVKELRDPTNRRFDYFFITCTNCGPRFTIIERLPYDRPNTTMRKFRMCPECEREYKDPADRRFHAQTIACSECGPKVYLSTNDGEALNVKDPVREAGKLLDEGHILAIKGNGGFHIATSTLNPEPIARLRKAKHRAQKPFAIMAKSVEAAASFAEVSPREAELLESPAKPIVLLKKSRSYYLAENVSPGLDTVGVMLPYTGLHLMLFDWSEEPAFVMTSANPPSEPIIKDNLEALKRLGKIVDYFLFHDREIAQRCDDSVVKLVAGGPSFLRRSRGYAPEPIKIKAEVKSVVLAVGAELNATSCILSGRNAFLSQHIGDVETWESLKFLEEATKNLVELTKSEVEAVACDLHPTFNTTVFASKLSDEMGVPLFKVQHHHAHVAKLMAEYGVDELIGIACDGFGYGLDGSAWGGEILYCHEGGFERLGHLEDQPMLGGDLATKYPLRMALGILRKLEEAKEWFLSLASSLPRGRLEAEVALRSLEAGRYVKTSSCGRVLDAVSAVLGLCYERTYEGEPAMKLEAAADGGKAVLNLPIDFKGNVIKTTGLLEEIFKLRGREAVKDLAYSAQKYVAESLAELAMLEAERLGVGAIGFSGGVAYNRQISSTIKKLVEGRGFKFLYPRAVPPGDGGISLGQAYAASFLMK